MEETNEERSEAKKDWSRSRTNELSCDGQNLAEPMTIGSHSFQEQRNNYHSLYEYSYSTLRRERLNQTESNLTLPRDATVTFTFNSCPRLHKRVCSTLVCYLLISRNNIGRVYHPFTSRHPSRTIMRCVVTGYCPCDADHPTIFKPSRFRETSPLFLPTLYARTICHRNSLTSFALTDRTAPTACCPSLSMP